MFLTKVRGDIEMVKESKVGLLLFEKVRETNSRRLRLLPFNRSHYGLDSRRSGFG